MGHFSWHDVYSFWPNERRWLRAYGITVPRLICTCHVASQMKGVLPYDTDASIDPSMHNAKYHLIYQSTNPGNRCFGCSTLLLYQRITEPLGGNHRYSYQTSFVLFAVSMINTLHP